MKSNMCTFIGCERKTFIAGYCNVCDSKFCKLHRLPEKHKCSTLNQYKQQLRSKNEDVLKKQRCVVPKIVDF